MAEKNHINTVKSTKLTLTNQNQLCLTGISKVITSTENVIMLVINGQTVNIEGEKLSVKKLDVKNGILEAEGTVTAIKYSHAKHKENFFKRVFG